MSISSRNLFSRPLLLATLLAAAAASGCKEREAATAAPPRAVRFVEADPQPLLMTAEATGRIEARYTSNVGFLVGGRLTSRTVDIGATVKVGDLLAEIDAVDFQNRLQAAQSQVAAAQATLDQAAPQEARYRQLLSQGYTTQAGYEQSLSALQNARATLEGAQANLRLSQDQLKYARLVAPTEGVVTQTGADVGQVVQAGQMIVQIARLDEREAVFSIAPQQVVYAHPGFAVKVWPQGAPNAVVSGRIREVAPNADPTTGSYTVKVALPDAPASLRLGTVVVGRAEVEGAVMVRLPSSALLQTGEKPQVWVVSSPDGAVHRRAVTVARYDADSVTISEGLQKGDRVVTAGVNSLAEGQKVSLWKGVSP